MHIFEMVAIVAVVAIIAGLAKEWINKQGVASDALSEISDRLTHLESLQQRIETLEAIVTDKGYDLKHKIDNLP